MERLFTLKYGNEIDGYNIFGTKMTEAEARKKMVAFVTEKFAGKYGFYYREHMTKGGTTYIDFGSHTYFFQLVPEKVATATATATTTTTTTTTTGGKDMTRLLNFAGNFAHFGEFFQKTNLPSTVCRFYDEDGCAIYKGILGYTTLPNDIMLHMVDLEGIESILGVRKAIETYGFEMRLLSTMMNEYGFDIIPCDQFDSSPDPSQVSAKATKKPSPDSCDKDCDCAPTAKNKTDDNQRSLSFNKDILDLMKSLEGIKQAIEIEINSAREVKAISKNPLLQ